MSAIASEPVARPPRGSAEEAIDAVREHLNSLADENRQLQNALDASRAALEHQREELTTLRRAANEFESAAEELRDQCSAALTSQARQYLALPLEGLLAAFFALERATRPADVLEAMMTALAREFSRVALCRVRSDRLEIVGKLGFGASQPAALTGAAGSLVARAAASAQIETALSAGDGGPSCAVALPFALGSATAVLYADDSDAGDFASPSIPHAKIKYAELLRLHAQLLLRITLGESVRVA